MDKIEENIIKIALVDDHKLFRKGLAEIINDFPGYNVICDLSSGKELEIALKNGINPDIVLLDINIPQMNGFEIAIWLKKFHPKIKILAVSMNNSEESILKMIQCSARGYILKDADPNELKIGLDEIVKKGFFHSELVSSSFYNSFQENLSNTISSLKRNEIEFLRLACSELTYKEIAYKMNLSPRTIDGYRENLFKKLNVKSRVGLAIYAIKNNIINEF